MLNSQELKLLQQTELGILSDFDDYCKEHGFKYYLIGGALLGAVRYGGFIPWDDDIDVAMPRDDYERLKREYRSKKYFLQNYESEPKFARNIQKIRLNGTEIIEYWAEDIDIHKGIYIDIFPIDYVDDLDAPKLNARAKKIRRLMSLSYIKRGYKSDRYKLIKGLIALLYPISEKQIEKKIYSLCTAENDSSGKYSILYLHNYSWQKQIHASSVFGDGSICRFEGREFQAPARPDEFLASVFGENYMDEPPIEKQKMPHNYLRVEFLENNSNFGGGVLLPNPLSYRLPMKEAS